MGKWCGRTAGDLRHSGTRRSQSVSGKAASPSSRRPGIFQEQAKFQMLHWNCPGTLSWNPNRENASDDEVKRSV